MDVMYAVSSVLRVSRSVVYCLTHVELVAALPVRLLALAQAPEKQLALVALVGEEERLVPAPRRQRALRLRQAVRRLRDQYHRQPCAPHIFCAASRRDSQVAGKRPSCPSGVIPDHQPSSNC